jgi:hypothetical protein
MKNSRVRCSLQFVCKTGTAALYRWGCLVQGSTIMIPPALGTIGNMTRDMFRGNPQFNRAGGNTPFGAPTLFGASAATPDVSNNNPALGSGGPREFQLGFRLSF